MKKYLIISFLLVLSQTIFSQAQNNVIDSLSKAVENTREDTVKVNILNRLADRLWRTGDYPKSLGYANSALSLAKKAGFKRGMLSAFNNIGIIYFQQGNYSEALKNFISSLKIAEETGNKQGAANAYCNMGIIYAQQENYSEALKSYKASLSVEMEANDKLGIASNYGNIGNIYLQQNNYPEALKNFSAALSIAKEFGYKEIASNAYNNIGIIYLNEKNYPEAMKSYLESLKIGEEIGDKYAVASSYVNLGQLALKQNDYSQAKEYFDKSLALANEIGGLDVVEASYFGFYQLDSLKGNLAGALNYHLKYIEIKDSILNEETNRQISQLKIQYETEKKDKEIEIKSIKIERQNEVIKYIIAGFVVLIIFAFIYFRLYFQKKKTAFQHQVLETEMKALRSQMNPHFTFNVLNSIQYYAGGNDMESVQLYLQKFSTLIRMILEQSRASYISLEQEISMLKLYLELEEMRFEKKFNYAISVDPKLEPAKILIPGMLIQPIVENAIKHGIEHKKGSAVISLTFAEQNSMLLCTITDNGIGRKAAEELKKKKNTQYQSAATIILKERMEALSSLYNIELACTTEDLVDSDGKPAGTKVLMHIPLNISL